jgi:hypothetical protein
MAEGNRLIAGRFVPLEPHATKPVRARDQATAQTVVLHEVADVDPRLVGLFHPGLLAIFDVVEHEGATLAACEFVPAQRLASVLTGGRCHPRRATEIVAELADALAELHALGLAHGAVTVNNVFVTEKGKAKLSLIDAVSGGSEAGDVMALRRLLSSIAAGPVPSIRTNSAAVLAAELRRLRSAEP